MRLGIFATDTSNAYELRVLIKKTKEKKHLFLLKSLYRFVKSTDKSLGGTYGKRSIKIVKINVVLKQIEETLKLRSPQFI